MRQSLNASQPDSQDGWNNNNRRHEYSPAYEESPSCSEPLFGKLVRAKQDPGRTLVIPGPIRNTRFAIPSCNFRIADCSYRARQPNNEIDTHQHVHKHSHTGHGFWFNKLWRHWGDKRVSETKGSERLFTTNSSDHSPNPPSLISALGISVVPIATFPRAFAPAVPELGQNSTAASGVLVTCGGRIGSASNWQARTRPKASVVRRNPPVTGV